MTTTPPITDQFLADLTRLQEREVPKPDLYSEQEQIIEALRAENTALTQEAINLRFAFACASEAVAGAQALLAEMTAKQEEQMARAEQAEATLENEEKICTSLSYQVDKWWGKALALEAENGWLRAVVERLESSLSRGEE
jgi:hypothetical protein